ncbi:MAG: hypothetical protein IKI50_07840 [Clostridia bacterium]|nr:hypothetical protein [Clostridia bacterium]
MDYNNPYIDSVVRFDLNKNEMETLRWLLRRYGEDFRVLQIAKHYFWPGFYTRTTFEDVISLGRGPGEGERTNTAIGQMASSISKEVNQRGIQRPRTDGQNNATVTNNTTREADEKSPASSISADLVQSSLCM